MNPKTCTLVVACLIVGAGLPLVAAEGNDPPEQPEGENEQYLVKVEGYHNPDPRWDGYCVKVTPGFGWDPPPACLNSGILASVAPETSEITVDMPDLDTIPDPVPEDVWNAWGDVIRGVNSERRDLQREADFDSWVHETGLAPDDPPLLVDAPCEPNRWDSLIVYTAQRVVCENMDLNLSRVHLEPTSMLVLRNTTLTFNVPASTSGGSDWYTAFIIKSRSGGQDDVRHPYHGGTFVMEDSRLVASPDDRVRLSSDPDTVIRIKDSEIDGFEWIYIRGFPTEGYGARDFSFINSTMKNGWGFYLGYTNAVIHGSFFENVSVPIRSHKAVMFDDNSVTGCGSAIIAWDEAAVSATNNTITDCYRAVIHQNHDECIPVRFNGNDVHGIRQHPIVSFCGDARANHWGTKPVESMVGWPFSADNVNFTEWSPHPLHPERLPRVEADIPAIAYVGEEVWFNASGSQGSEAFGFSLAAYEWTIQTWIGPVPYFHCDPGCAWMHSPAKEHLVGREISYLFDEPGEYPVHITVVDEKGFQSTLETTIEVRERPPEAPPELPKRPILPVVESVFIHPEEPREGEALFAEADISPGDLDHNVLTFWYRDGELYAHHHSDFNDMPMIPGNVTRAGEVWHVEVYANTTHGRSEAGIGNVTILERSEDHDEVTTQAEENHHQENETAEADGLEPHHETGGVNRDGERGFRLEDAFPAPGGFHRMLTYFRSWV